MAGSNNEGVLLDVNKTQLTLKDNKPAKISFTTNKGNKYTVVDTSNNQKIISATASTGVEQLTFSEAGTYRLTVKNDDDKKSEVITVKAASQKAASSIQSKDATEQKQDQAAPADTQSEKSATSSSVPADYKSALKKAKSYSDTMYMSKQGIYDQLTSEYGEKFSPEAAQYAVDNLKADYNANALEKAKSYQKDMDMSPEGIRDQLTSQYGEKFTQDEANYAIEHLND